MILDTLTLREKCPIRSFFDPCFPVFGLNTGKYRPEKTPYLDTFHVVWAWAWFLEYFSFFDDIESRDSSKNTSYEKETFCKLYHNYKSLLKLLKINKLLVSSNWIVVEK